MRERQPEAQRRASTEDAPARRALLEATSSLLRSQGPPLTSRAIAAAAGENLASITYYFGSKEQLVAEAMVELARRLLQPVVDALEDRSADPVARMLTAVQLLQRLRTEQPEHLPGYLHALAAATTSERVRSAIRELNASIEAVLASLIADQQRAGTLPAWIEPAAMAKLLVATANGAAIAAAIDPGGADDHLIGAQLVQLLLNARAGAGAGSSAAP